MPDHPLALHHITRELKQDAHSASIGAGLLSFQVQGFPSLPALAHEQVCVSASKFSSPPSTQTVCQNVWDVGTPTNFNLAL